MAMFDSNIDYTKLIQFTPSGGIVTASYVEIRDALVKRYREIYGNDIDTSSASADGQFINSIALIIFNICSTFEYSFKQLNPNTATGKYLDILCSYNNVQRIKSSRSVAQLQIYNNSDNDIIGSDLLFIDRNNKIWKWVCPIDANSDPTITFVSKKVTPITDVYCIEEGAIEAKGSPYIDSNGHETNNISENDWTKECPGDIYQFVDVNPVLRIWQHDDAVVGYEDESDESLRTRRNSLIGMNSVSILDGLKGALLNLQGIREVFIYNNYTGTDAGLSVPPTADSTTVPAHSIYIVIRYEEGVNIDDYTIGNLIYNKLTPGVGTTVGTNSYTFNISENVSYTVYWKKCSGNNHPTIVLNYKTNNNYNFPISSGSIKTTSHDAETDIEINIANNIQKYIDNIKIDNYLQPSGLLTRLQQSDLLKNGVPTLFADSCTIGGSATQSPANLDYFKYNTYKFTYNTSNHTGTLTISHSS